MDKKEILAPGTETGPWTLTQILDEGKGKPVFIVETQKAYYVANILNDAMMLWVAHSMHGNTPAEPLDDSEVINVLRIG